MQNQGLGANAPPTKHARPLAGVDEVAALTKPTAVHECEGSDLADALRNQPDALGEPLARPDHPARVLERA